MVYRIPLEDRIPSQNSQPQIDMPANNNLDLPQEVNLDDDQIEINDENKLEEAQQSSFGISNQLLETKKDEPMQFKPVVDLSEPAVPGTSAVAVYDPPPDQPVTTVALYEAPEEPKADTNPQAQSIDDEDDPVTKTSNFGMGLTNKVFNHLAKDPSIPTISSTLNNRKPQQSLHLSVGL